ncbi:sigma-70 family RNA polymerase sigma factor [Verrucosispora sp. FIM060022]|uniref:RNA polymerase sigma factor n=1 Tax=Verrucosispora sp. FIM060022 TaxID=1479020 RepID=UPI000F89B52A|nr:sigma-70 family RNA polymerase sigma factor [Verrucosispora sp. FIM060022]RUL95126.1 sigma-70 family RNA polymerase sigma factor [Verrucosispora sp. FIM060022]
MPRQIGTDSNQGRDVGSVESRPKLTRAQVEQIEQLYLHEAEDLYRYAHSRSWIRAGDAHDLVQTTFHEAIRAWEKVEPLGVDERRRWLRQVLRNKAVDVWRKQNRVDLAVDVSELHPTSDDETAEHVALTIALANCWRAIEQMPPRRRMVAFLVWGQAWDVKRAAEHLGLAASTVRVHLREARLQLRASVGHLVPFIEDEEDWESA